LRIPAATHSRDRIPELKNFMLKPHRAFALVAALLLAACGTETTAPASIVHTGGPPLLLGDLPLFVEVLQRTAPLPRTRTASATIDADGGTIAIPEAGFRIDFPAGAVSEPVEVSVTAPAGRNVAYEFQPHGLRFARSPVITQELRGTTVYGNVAARARLEGAYSPSLLGLLGSLLRISETRPTTVQVDTWQMRWNVEHFSGYVASARRSGYISSSGTLIPID
jgi:ZU5 domain